jgi:predicted amidohydrolase
MVVDPHGQVVAQAGANETVLYADVDVNEVTRWRLEFPALNDRVLD